MFRTIVPILWGSRRRSVLVEFPLLVATSAIVVFFIALPLKAPLDALWWQARANYETFRTSAGLADGTALRLENFPVAPEGAGGQTPTYAPLATFIHVDVVADWERYWRYVGSNTEDRGPGLYLDTDTAMRMGVKAGDKVVLLTNLLAPGAPSPHFRVVGIVPPYGDPQAPTARGLAFVDAASVPPDFIALLKSGTNLEPSRTQTLWVDPDSGTGTSRGTTIAGVALALFSEDWVAFLGGLLLCALVLDVIVIERSTSLVLRRMFASSALLVALGSTSRNVVRANVLPQAALVLASSLVGTSVVAGGIFPLVLHWSLQLASALPILVLMASVAGIHAWYSAVRLDRELVRMTPAALAVTGEE